MEGIVDSLTQPGRPWEKYADRLYEALQLYSLSHTFHWTPEQIRAMDEYDRMIYMSIMAGETQARVELEHAPARK